MKSARITNGSKLPQGHDDLAIPPVSVKGMHVENAPIDAQVPSVLTASPSHPGGR